MDGSERPADLIAQARANIERSDDLVAQSKAERDERATAARRKRTGHSTADETGPAADALPPAEPAPGDVR